MGLFDLDGWGDKPKKKKRKKKTTKKESTSSPKRRVFTADFNYLMAKQKGWCVYKDCVSLNRVKQKVTTLKDMDHKIPIKLWELMGKKGDPNQRWNLQLLCVKCHRHKTAEDKKSIVLYKEKHGVKTKATTKATKKTTKKTSAGKTPMVTVEDMFGNKKRIPKSKARRVEGLLGGKYWEEK